MKREHELLIDDEVDEDSDHKQVWIHQDGKENSIEKKIKVEIEDGEKK